VNLFNNIKTLDLSVIDIQFDEKELVQKIHLPFIHTLSVLTSRSLKCFRRLESLRHIIFDVLYDIGDVEAIVNPTKL
jgi:hypothetical protein